MNTTAVFVGLFHGSLSVVVCYFVSMLTSGLFARPFYRLYSGLLIGICSLMLLAPGLRWLALQDPQLAVLALTLAQYGVFGALGYGVCHFNHHYLKRLFLERTTTVYFTFGTLANAALVTTAFLHMAVSGTPDWNQLAPGYLTPANYGPIVVLLAAMIFHTDFHLKQSLGNLRRFSSFTFVGYAVSFIGLGLSLVPYVGQTLGESNLVAIDSPLLQNFAAAQALLMAVVLYAWLVWRYESIPPLFLLLLAIIGEYHILVSQWVIRSWGMESWALASLPLFAGLMKLDHYFARWDQRKRSASDEGDAKFDAESETADNLRFAMPFRWVGATLAISLFVISLWARFFGTASGSPMWLGVTFTIYSLYFVAIALFRREPRLIYVSGLLAGLVTLFGISAVHGESATSLLAVMAAASAAMVLLGERVGLKLSWKTPLTDCALLGAILVTLLVLWRQFPVEGRGFFPGTNLLDTIALACAAVTYLVTAHQYRSRLPVYGAVIILALMVPAWSAAVGLAAMVAAGWIERRMSSRNQGHMQEPLLLFGIARLPAADTLPSLYVNPLWRSAIALALVGLMASVISILQRDSTLTVLAGSAISPLVLGMLTTRYRRPWLYLTSLFATYFAIQNIAHVMLFQHWPVGHIVPAHLLLTACLSLLGGMIALVYSAWCAAMLRRVAEAKEAALRASRTFYAGWLFHTVSSVTVVTLLIVTLAWASKTSEPLLLLVSAALVSLLFAGGAAIYRTQVGSYLSLSALTLILLIAGDVFELPRWDGAVPAVMGLCVAALSWLTLHWSRSQPCREVRATQPENWLGSPSILPARGMSLWSEPLAVYAMICTVPAMLSSIGFSPEAPDDFQLTSSAPIIYLLTGITLLLCTRTFRQPLLYVFGIGLGFGAAHAGTALRLDPSTTETLGPLAHVVVAAGTSLVCCIAGAIIALALNWSAWRGDEERRKSLATIRDFYAAPLVDIAFLASLAALLGLAYWMNPEVIGTRPVAISSSVVGLLTALTFGLSAAIYQSRISSYCALAAGGVAVHAVMVLFAADSTRPLTVRLDTQALVHSAAAVLLGGLSYWIARWEPRDVADIGTWSGDEREAGSPAMPLPRLLQCCQKPPLPLVSRDLSLWSIPLSHGSVALALSALLFAGLTGTDHHGLPMATALQVLPMYLAALALLIATTTHRTGWLQFGVHGKNLHPRQRRIQGDWAERGVLYVLSLLSLGAAVHMTAQRVALDELPQRVALNWHLVVAMVLVLIGWFVAKLLTPRLPNRTQRFDLFTNPEPPVPAAGREMTDQRDLPQAASTARGLYAGLLHHVCLAVAFGVFGVAGTLTVASPVQAGPLLGSLCLLIFYFILSADSYRAPLLTYFAAIVSAFGAVACLAMLGQPLMTLGIAWAALALAFWLAGFGVERRQRSRSESTPERLSGEYLSGERLSGERLSGERLSTEHVSAAAIRIYEQPLIRCSAVMAGIAVGQSLMAWLRDGWLDSLAMLVITLALSAVTLMLNARSLNLSERGVWARAMVHLACLLFAGCWLLVSTTIWPSPAGLGPNAAIMALLLGGVGLRLVEHARGLMSQHPASAASRMTFGEPMSHFASGLAIIATALSAFALGLSQQLSQGEGSLLQSEFALLRSASITFLVTSVVCLVSVRVQQWLGWLYAAVILASCGILMLIQSQLALTPETLAVGTLALMNLLMAFARWARNNHDRVGNFLGLRDAGCERPFHEWPVVCATGLLAGQIVYLGMMYSSLLFHVGEPLDATLLGGTWQWICASLLAGWIFFQAYRMHLKVQFVHLLILSSVICIAGIGLSSHWMITPDVAITLLGVMWGAVAAVINHSSGAQMSRLLRLPLDSSQQEQGEKLLLGWASGLVLLGLALSLPVSWLLADSLWNLAMVLAIATLAALCGGLRWRNVSATTLSAILFPLCLTCAIVAYGYHHLLLMGGHLLTAVLAVVYLSVSVRLDQCRIQLEEDRKPFSTGVSQSLARLAQLLTCGAVPLALLSILHAHPALPTVLSLGLVSTLWGRFAWNGGKESFAYAAIAGYFVMIVYASDAVLQISSTNNSVAAFSVIACSFLLYGINLLVSRSGNAKVAVFLRPSYYSALAMPVALLATIPMVQPAVAPFALLAGGAFYMTVTRQSQTRWTLYVAAALVNFAVYLWLPAASTLTGLYQLYVIPAAITVLVFVQLHRRDLKPRVLTALRLAASGCILAVSTSEVFFSSEPSIVQFLAVLMLSLAGITVGVSLRIKPFIHVGIAFLIVNVVGQLGLQIHREAGVMRAVILIGVGLAVLAMMVFFNIHRERILSRYQRFAADRTWE